MAALSVQFCGDPVNVVIVLMKPVVGDLVQHIKENQETNGHTDSQTHDIDEGKTFPFPKVPECGFQIIA
jgi:hypothetical protein